MNLDSLSFTLSQISYLVANLSKKNFEDICQEISDVSNKLILEKKLESFFTFDFPFMLCLSKNSPQILLSPPSFFYFYHWS